MADRHTSVCVAKVEHFEQLAAILARHGQQSMPEMMRAAAEHKLLPLFKALQYVTFQTANIPLTQGYKMSLRQLGFALNLYDGQHGGNHSGKKKNGSTKLGVQL